MDLVGFLFALLSAVFNGSFVAFAKIESVASANCHPMIFNLYVGTGVFLSSLLALPFLHMVDATFQFTHIGAVGGALFAAASIAAFVAVPIVGLSTGQGLWGGAAILVSFLWGTLGPAVISNPVKDLPMSLLAVFLLLVGVIGIVKAEPIATWTLRALKVSPDEKDVSVNTSTSATEPFIGIDDTKDPESLEASQKPLNSAAKQLVGLFAALCVGIFGGSVLVPMKYLDPALFGGKKSLAFLPSFGLGCFALSFIACVTYCIRGLLMGERPRFEFRSNCWAGLMSGLCWNLGNLCQIIAQSFFTVPYGVAYPVLQASLVIAGILGIFVFKELTGRPNIAVFFTSSTLVLAGALILGIFGPTGA